jgi:5'-methylthioadenosine phosphorylase
MKSIDIGVIGGSGIYSVEGVEGVDEWKIDTPYGATSSEIVHARVGGRDVAFLARHGKGHRYNPTHVPYRANIFALKMLGVKTIFSVSAVGSLKEELAPRDFVLPDQVIDRTRLRTATFFDNMAVHVGFADPFCNRARALIAESAQSLPVRIHSGGTYVCMEGPLFSTKAESKLYRSWDASVIGMTALPEAKLAREAEICYATVAMVTDYDVWKEEHVSVEAVVATLKANAENANGLLLRLIETARPDDDCPCRHALANAVMTRPDLISEQTRRELEPLLGRYFPVSTAAK